MTHEQLLADHAERHRRESDIRELTRLAEKYGMSVVGYARPESEDRAREVVKQLALNALTRLNGGRPISNLGELFTLPAEDVAVVQQALEQAHHDAVEAHAIAMQERRGLTHGHL